MNQYDPKALFDGFSSLEGGQDAGRGPHLIGRNQAARMVNIDIRGGYPKTRPGWNTIALTFDSAEDQSAFEGGRFQGASTFCAEPKRREIVVAISGRLWRINEDGKVHSLVSEADRNSREIQQVWMEQVEDTLVVQDGQSRPFLYNGGSCRRSNTDEVPVGTVMSYTNGRLWVAMPNGRDFVAGDLLGTTTGPLKFTENTFLSEGGAFQVPGAAGKIVAMQTMSTPDTSLGEGDLLIICEHAVYAVNVPFDRDLWKATTYPIMRALLLNAGGVGGWSAQCVNSDVFFRAQAGIWSVIRAQRSFDTWGNSPVSREIQPVVDHDDRILLAMCSSVVFDNRLLMTYSPIRDGMNVAHEGVIVLEFDAISGMNGKTSPAYSGTWKRSDVQILKLVSGTFSGVPRCHFIGLDSSGDIGLWEITKDKKWDDEDLPITCILDSRSASFGNEWTAKELNSGELWTDQLSGPVLFTAYWRPDQLETDCDLWRTWHTWYVIVPHENCVVNDGLCKTVTTHQEQYRPRKMLPWPDESDDANIDRPYRIANEFQVRLEWTGHARIKRMLLKAYEVQEDVTRQIT